MSCNGTGEALFEFVLVLAALGESRDPIQIQAPVAFGIGDYVGPVRRIIVQLSGHFADTIERFP